MYKVIIFSLFLSIAGLFVSCGETDKPSNTMAPIKTNLITDSLGYDVENKSSVFSTISLDSPEGLDKTSYTNYINWLSETLSCEKSTDKDAAKSLARAYIYTAAANLKNKYTKLDNKLKKSAIKLWDIVRIKKVYDDDHYVTFIFDREYFGGEYGVQSASIGYTFNRSDFSLADLISKEDKDYYCDLIMEDLGKTLVNNPENLTSVLYKEAIDANGKVNFPAHGAYLINDTLYFQYQELEIAPSDYGMLCVKIPMKKS